MKSDTNKENIEEPLLYAYLLGLFTSGTVMIGFVLLLKCCD